MIKSFVFYVSQLNSPCHLLILIWRNVAILLFHPGARILRLPQNPSHHPAQLHNQAINLPYHRNNFLIQGKVGPFKAGLETHVPLWLALQLKASDKCKIYEPFWF